MSPKQEVECDNCGEEMNLYPSQITSVNACSVECRNEIHSRRMKGENNPFYGESHTEESKEQISKNTDNRGRKNPNFDDWSSRGEYPPEWTAELRARVRREYDYECEDCGINQESLDERLQVHHIDGNKKNCNTENLVALCRECHGKRHNRGEIA